MAAILKFPHRQKNALGVDERLALLDTMSAYQERVAKEGHTLKSIVDGITLYECVLFSAETEELKQSARQIIDSLKEKLQKYNTAWNK
jgi:outer membrane protein OmpA-like peptidoglycan-associated protein